MSTITAPAGSKPVPGAAAAPARRAVRDNPALWLTLAAIALRLIVFTSRGGYIAFDEGWYLLLGRSVFDGTGYTLTGLRHTTLSPLFPLLAGAAGALINNAIWGGRIIAAIAGGLLVWPCWHIFRRIGGQQVAIVACFFIVVMPSLTPFAAPYWINWDLWVGAEPVLHLFLFAALALLLRARARDRALDWALAGAAFALAYLARPEAVIPLGIAGLAVGIEVLARRNPRRIANALLLAIAFAVTAAPYWLYLHDALGRWALSGRAVDQPVAQTPSNETPGATRRGGAASGIERMLWEGRDRQYVRALYGLDASGTRLGSTYWGVPDTIARAAEPMSTSAAPPVRDEPLAATAGTPRTSARPTAPPGRWLLYGRSLGTILPWFLWPLILVGMLRRGIGREELLVAVPLIITSFAIARMVGADPRTQLLIVPLAALYAAVGVVRIGAFVEQCAANAGLRRGFVTATLAVVVVTGLLSTVGHWVYMGITMGSPHHTVGAANRSMGEAIRRIVPADEPIMSWHPATALYADREWRALPYAGLAGIVRYANAIGCEYVVLSAYYPGRDLMHGIDRDHLVLHIPPGAPTSTDGWRIDLHDGSASYVMGRLVYAPGGD